MKNKKKEKVLAVRKYIEDDLEITETAKQIDEDTETITTPWGTEVKAGDIVRVLEEYYALSKEHQEREKEAWIFLISKMMGEREDGLKVVDIILSPNGSREIKFVYR